MKQKKLMNQEIKKQVSKIVKQSGSSFYWSMRLLPIEKRDAMFAIYAFCRIIDDIVDEPAPIEEKQKQIEFWKLELNKIYEERPSTIIGKALLEPVKTFNLDKQEFEKLIYGVAMDLPSGICAPPMKELLKYCRGVAGAVGMLSIKIFGCNDKNAQNFAICLGNALQLTNILRDPYEDMKIGRLYLPKEMLTKENISIGTPKEILTNGNIGKVRENLAQVAQEEFDKANSYLNKTDAKKMKPAIIMMNAYYDIFAKMQTRGWDVITPKPKVNKFSLLFMALKTHFIN